MSESDPKAQQEPTMEEILASIRRIISENEDDEQPQAADEGADDGETPETDDAAEAPEAKEEEVLELTEVVEEDGSVVSLSDEDGKEAPEEAAEVTEPEPEPEPDPEPEPEEPVAEEPVAEEPVAEELVAAPANTLVSEQTADASTSALSELNQELIKEPEAKDNIDVGTGRTLEDLVKDMLRPMLKEWLDENLTPMVEHLVKMEIQRMVRKAEDQ